MRAWLIFRIAIVALWLSACASAANSKAPVATANEQPVTLIPLDGLIATKKAELSGLAWYGDTLILLPQYPDRFGADDGMLFAIPKQAILDFLDHKSSAPITPATIKFVAPHIKDQIKHFEGYEAIAFAGDHVYLTIESGKNAKMIGYLVDGKISSDGSEIQLDSTHLTPIAPAVLLDNRTDESLVILGNQIFTFFEVNGSGNNLSPTAHVFNFNLAAQGTMIFPHLEDRVTDATTTPDGKIWVINTFSAKDADIIRKTDPLIEKYGEGATQKQYDRVERLVALEKKDFGITLADLAPIDLQLTTEARNWEGLAPLDGRGFLLVTDTSPDTLLGFVPMP